MYCFMSQLNTNASCKTVILQVFFGYLEFCNCRSLLAAFIVAKGNTHQQPPNESLQTGAINILQLQHQPDVWIVV